METGERIDVDPAYVRNAYREQIQAFVQHYRRSCVEANIDYVFADTSTPYDFLLSRYLAKRTQL